VKRRRRRAEIRSGRCDRKREREREKERERERERGERERERDVQNEPGNIEREDIRWELTRGHAGMLFRVPL